MLIDRTSNYLFIYFVGEKIFTNSNMVDGSLEQEIVGDKPRSPSIFEADIFHPLRDDYYDARIAWVWVRFEIIAGNIKCLGGWRFRRGRFSHKHTDN